MMVEGHKKNFAGLSPSVCNHLLLKIQIIKALNPQLLSEEEL